MKINNFKTAIDYLYSLELYGIKLGLDNIRRVLEKLGNPHSSLKFIHVGGTNGKGSVCAMLSSVLKEAGYRVGSYTSPHLISFRERIQINGEQIPEEKIVELTKQLQQIALEIETETDIHPTYFEITTAMALKYFSDEKIDLAILEVGMGGRFDATNIVTPLITIINDISIDHSDYLGETVEKIAFEKAGIIKENVPLIISDQSEEAASVISNVAMEKKVDTFVLKKDFDYNVIEADKRGLRVDMRFINNCLIFKDKDEFSRNPNKNEYSNIFIPLIGEFQGKNCAISMAALALLKQIGWNISDDAIYFGFSKVSWPARIQVMQKNPFVILDSSHNRKSMANLVNSISKYFSYKDLILIIGLVKEKERDAIVSELLKLKPKVIAVKPESHRALEPEVLQEEFNKFGIGVDVKTDIIDGIRHALELAKPVDLIVITGSFYTAGTALSYWNKTV